MPFVSASLVLRMIRSEIHHDRSPFSFGSMQPITIVKRFLNRTTPSIPLPEDIGDEPTTVACQTSAPLQFQEEPRSSLKKNVPLHHEEALQPPSFKPRSKLPRLHYGGLQIPELHCFASSLTTSDTAHPQKADVFFKPTATSLASPATFRKAAISLQSTATTKTNQMQKEPDLFFVKYSMKFDSHPNFIVKFTTLNLSTNISTVLLIVPALEDYLCTCRFGTTGPAGANVIQFHQQRHLFRWSWIIYTPQIISNENRTPSLQEPG